MLGNVMKSFLWSWKSVDCHEMLVDHSKEQWKFWNGSKLESGSARRLWKLAEKCISFRGFERPDKVITCTWPWNSIQCMNWQSSVCRSIRQKTMCVCLYVSDFKQEIGAYIDKTSVKWFDKSKRELKSRTYWCAWLYNIQGKLNWVQNKKWNRRTIIKQKKHFSIIIIIMIIII